MTEVKKFFRTACIMAGFLFPLWGLGGLNAQSWPPEDMNGNGTSGDPWQIAEYAHLKALANYVNGGNANNTIGMYYILTDDIDLSEDLNWKPIGSDEAYNWIFKGNFDGNQHVITNLTIYRTSDYIRTYGTGLFGMIQGATIKNLGIEGSSVIGDFQVGTLVGKSENSNITNCYAADCQVQGYSCVGGLLGVMGNGISDEGYITQCYTTGNVSVTSCFNETSGLPQNPYDIGGLVGVGFNISQCYSACNVTGVPELHDALGYNIGGLAGGGYDITQSYATGDVIGGNGIGGLLGNENASMVNGVSITQCYATGNVTGNTRVGGLVGVGVKIFNCYATGNVTAIDNVGGLVGYVINVGQVGYCYASGTVTSSEGTNKNIGGLAGYLSSNSYVFSSVAANDSLKAYGTTYAIGRIIGGYQGSNYAYGNNAYNGIVAIAGGTYLGFTDGANNRNGVSRNMTTLTTASFYSTKTNWWVSEDEWDIQSPSGVWKICEGEGLPFLRWQGINCNNEGFIPVSNITDVPTTATTGTPLTLTGTVTPSDATNKTIVWSIKDAGTTGASISDNTLNTTAEGTVEITATIANGLAIDTDYTQDFILTVNSVGIVSATLNDQLWVYPNPTHDKFVVELEGVASLKLYDMIGKELLTRTADGKTEIDISHLSKGVYTVHVFSEGKVIGNAKIVKQ